MVACRCPTVVWPPSSWTSGRWSASRRCAAATAWPVPCSTVRPPCPDELFHRFPQVGTVEIHLATGFQNALYDHPAFPPELLAEIGSWWRGQRGRRTQGWRDGQPVRLQDAQEGAGAAQASAVGAGHQGRDHRQPGGQGALPDAAARGHRHQGDGRPLRGRPAFSPDRYPRPCALPSRPALPADRPGASTTAQRQARRDSAACGPARRSASPRPHRRRLVD